MKLFKIILTFLFSFLFLLSPFLLSANKDKLQRHDVETQEALLKAEIKIKEAHDKFINEKYKKAKDLYLKSLEILTEILPGSNKKIKSVKESLSLVYSHWAKDLYNKANKEAGSGKIKKAISLAEKVKKLNPEMKDKANRLIKKLNKIQNNKNFEKLTDIENKETKRKNYSIDVLKAQGKNLYKAGKLEKARRKFNRILKLSPYHTEAIRYLRLINNEFSKAAQQREQMTTNKRIAEATWESIPSIKTKSISGGRIDIETDSPITKKANKIKKIQDKLNNITVKDISLNNIPVTNALKYLQKESKRLDPQGKGINIFWKLKDKKSPSKPKNIAEKDLNSSSQKNNSSQKKLISLSLENVPLKTVLKHLCNKAGLDYQIKDYAVLVLSKGAGINELKTKVFAVPKDVFNTKTTVKPSSKDTSIDLKKFFQSRGIKFPEDTSAVYDSRVSRLIVRNTPKQLLKIKNILKKLNIYEPQIAIKSKIVEMKQEDFEELGFEWRLGNPGKAGGSYDVNDPINRFASATNDKKDKEFGFHVKKSGVDFNTIMHALNQTENKEILSSPRVNTLNGETATIEMISEEWIPHEWDDPQLDVQINEEAGEGGAYETIIPAVPQFDEPTPVGISFSVTPYIQKDNYTIDLVLRPQVRKLIAWTEYDYKVSETGGGTDADTAFTENFQIKMPIIRSRSIKTRVSVEDGGSVVMGGVIQSNTEEKNDKIPILGDMPLVGRFFSSSIDDTTKINLLIFTKVRLVNPDGTPLRPKKSPGMPLSTQSDI